MTKSRLNLAVAGSPAWLTAGLVEWLRTRGAVIEAVLDTQPEAARALADRYHARWAFCDWQHMHREAQIHAVVLAAGQGLPAVRQALKAGWSVLLDGPLAGPSAPMANLVRRLSGRATPFVMQSLPHRFAPAVRQLCQLIASGQFGQPVGISYTAAISCRDKAHHPPAELPSDGTMLGIVDLIAHLAGSIESVFASANVEGVVSATLRCEGGTIGTLHIEPGQTKETAGSHLTLSSRQAWADLRNHCELECWIQGAAPVLRRPNLACGALPEVEGGHQGMLEEFASAVLARRRPVGHLASLRQVFATLRATKRSLEKGRTVEPR